jgi:uncharacterized protein (UPF0333 family)
MIRLVLASIGIVVSMMACKQESASEPAPSAATSASAAAQTVAAAASPSAAPPIDSVAAAVPVPEDFEEEAKKTVTSDTLNSQLDKLEKTIASAPVK